MRKIRKKIEKSKRKCEKSGKRSEKSKQKCEKIGKQIDVLRPRPCRGCVEAV